MAVDGGARKDPCQLIHASSCPILLRAAKGGSAGLVSSKIQLVELGIDADHPIGNCSLLSPVPCEDKDLILDSLVTVLFLNGIVANPQDLFQPPQARLVEDFSRVK